MRAQGYIVLLLSYLFPFFLHAQSSVLLPVKSQGKWGYCDTLGTLRIPLQYDLAGLFHENGLAAVKQDGISYLINQKGEIITQGKCQDILFLNSNLYACYNGQSWKIHGPNYTYNFPYDIAAIENTRSSNLIIHTKQGSGLMANDASILIEAAYDMINEASFPGYYILYKDSLMGVADETGNIILPVQYYFTDFRSPGIIVYKAENKVGFTSLDGKIKTDTIYTDVRSNPLEPFVILTQDSILSAYNLNTGKTFTCTNGNFINFFDANYLMFYTSDGLNLLNENMEILFDSCFQTIRREDEGFVVSKDKRFGYYNSKGKNIFPLEYQYITNFIEGTAISTKNNKKGVLHSEGTILAENMYDKAEVYSQTAKMYAKDQVNVVEFDSVGTILGQNSYTNFMTIRLGGFKDMRRPTQSSDSPPPSIWFYYPDSRKWGLNSPTGEIILPPLYNTVVVLDNKYTKVAIEEISSISIDNITLITQYKWGLVNHQTGEVEFKPYFADIHRDTSSGLNTFIFIDHATNFFIKDYDNKSLYGPFSWLGKIHNNTRPIAVGGKLKSYKEDTLHRKISSPSEYINTTFSPNLFINRGWYSNNAFLTLEGAKYFSLWDCKAQALKGDRHDYMSEFTDDYLRIGTKGNEYGVINYRNDTIVFPQYQHIEIIHSTDNTFFLKYKKRQAYGFVNRNGTWAFEKKFAQNGFFSDGIACMGLNDRGATVFIDTLGQINELRDVRKISPFSEGMAAIKIGREWGFIDKEYNTLYTDNNWNWTGSFKQNLAPVRSKSDYYFIDEYGNRAFKTNYDKALPFNEFGALVRLKKGWGLIDAKGEFIIKPNYNRIVYKPADSLYYCYTSNGFLLKRPDGTSLITKKIQYLKKFVNGYTAARLTNGTTVLLSKEGYYSKAPKGMKLNQVFGEFCVLFSDDNKLTLTNNQFYTLLQNKLMTRYILGSDGIIFGKERKNGWVGIDLSGKTIFKVKGTPIQGFQEGYAIIRASDNRKMYINENGEQAFGSFFIEAESFSDGYARVKTESGWGMLDASGNYIISPKYKNLSKFTEGFASVCLESLISISNKKDIPLVDGEYDYVKLEKNGFFRVESADRVGWISRDGNVIWNPIR